MAIIGYFINLCAGVEADSVDVIICWVKYGGLETMKILLKVTVIIVAVLIAISLYLPVKPLRAQAPIEEVAGELADEPTPTPEDVSTEELVATAGLTVTGDIRSRDITWADLDYGDRRLSTDSSSARFTFDVPGDLVFLPGSFTKLVVSHTGGQTEKDATLRVNLNDHVLGIVQLTEENDDRGEIQLDISPEHLKTGSNDLNVSLAARDVCGSDELPAEAVLHSEGLIHLEYTIVPREPDLVLYPVPFFEQAFETSLVYFVLPDSPTPDDMTVAATISAGLGRYSRGEIQIGSVTPAELTSEIRDNYNLIVIGRPETNSFLAELPLPLSLERANVAPDHGILEEIESPWNPRRMVLVVTGKTDEGMFKAGAALNRQILFPSLKGQVVIVQALLDPPVDEFNPLQIDRTFEDLGYSDRVIYGARPTSQRFHFSMPTSWQMSENPSLTLRFTHSEVLSDSISTLDVGLNGVPVGSTLLDHDNTQDGLLEVELPSWLLRSGGNYIEVFVDMAIAGGDECLDATSHQAWTVINRHSNLHLPYESQPVELNLANMFQPLTDVPNLDDTYLALPGTLNSTERDALLNLAVRLGAAARGNYLALQAGWVDELTAELKQNYHIITIGQPSLNPLIREVNDSLPQPFVPDSNEPLQIHNPAVITFDPQRSIGFVQLLASPWNPDKALLIVTGTDSEGVTAAFDLLVNETGSLNGDLVVIEDEELHRIDTRPLRAERVVEDSLRTVRPDATVRVAQAERWW